MPLHRSKLDWIGPQVDGKAVLDLGCVCHDPDQTVVPWLHPFLRERAARVVGVDYLPDGIETLKQRLGGDLRVADVQTMDLGETFDVIVAGDIIEHLDNLGDFLDRCVAHLAPGGRLLVTTPNPITLVRCWRVLLKGTAGANKEHTCWFTAKVLSQLAARHGLRTIEEAYVDDTRLFYPWLKPDAKRTGMRRTLRSTSRLLGMAVVWKPLLLIQSLLVRLRPRLAETLCMSFQRAE